MLLPIALRAINHVLKGEDWALKRLRAFAGQSLRLELGRFQVPVRIDDKGLLVAQPASDSPAPVQPTVVITLPEDTPARLLLDPASLVGLMTISGSAELADHLNFIFKNLRWDAEHDLARVVGDIAARRLVKGGKQLLRWQTAQMSNAASNVVEFFTNEQATLVQRDEMSEFAASVATTRTALADLESRIATLERPSD
jgi:ubiquinone biosynthesis accessory factor UbiJ